MQEGESHQSSTQTLYGSAICRADATLRLRNIRGPHVAGHLVVQVGLIDIREYQPTPVINSVPRAGTGTPVVMMVTATAIRENAMRIVIVMYRQANLFQIVAALRTTCRLSRLLNGREKQGNQYRYDCNHYQQLDQSKATTFALHDKLL